MCSLIISMLVGGGKANLFKVEAVGFIIIFFKI